MGEKLGETKNWWYFVYLLIYFLEMCLLVLERGSHGCELHFQSPYVLSQRFGISIGRTLCRKW